MSLFPADTKSRRLVPQVSRAVLLLMAMMTVKMTMGLSKPKGEGPGICVKVTSSSLIVDTIVVDVLNLEGPMEYFGK